MCSKQERRTSREGTQSRWKVLSTVFATKGRKEGLANFAVLEVFSRGWKNVQGGGSSSAGYRFVHISIKVLLDRGGRVRRRVDYNPGESWKIRTSQRSTIPISRAIQLRENALETWGGDNSIS